MPRCAKKDIKEGGRYCTFAFKETEEYKELGYTLQYLYKQVHIIEERMKKIALENIEYSE